MSYSNIDNILQKIQKFNKSKVIIKVDGRGGSGKSTISKDLASKLQDSLYVNLDDYTLDNIDLFDKENIEIGFNIDFQNKEYDQTKLQEIIKSTKNKYIILEGCFSFKNTPQISADYKVWIEVSRKVAAQRLNQRERNDPGRVEISTGNIELATEKWQQSEDEYIAEYRPEERADDIIEN